MSRAIDMSGDLASLSYEDKQYLSQRGLLPTSVASIEEQREMNKTADQLPLEERANTGDVNAQGLTIEQLEELLEAKRAEMEATDTEALFGQEGVDAVEQDEDEITPPYDRYTNAQLTGELARRNEDRDEDDQLSLTGNKAELVARLEEDDKE